MILYLETVSSMTMFMETRKESLSLRMEKMWLLTVRHRGGAGQTTGSRVHPPRPHKRDHKRGKHWGKKNLN